MPVTKAATTLSLLLVNLALRPWPAWLAKSKCLSSRMSRGKESELRKASVHCQVGPTAAAFCSTLNCYFSYADPSDVFTVSFFESHPGHLQGAQFTHENMTAGVAATRALLPLSHALSSLDTIISAHSLSTPYGRAIGYTAIFEGTSFATLASSKLYHVEESE
jgi:acyl-CoA synthetase (AMP-forming)/AMP-acid ligase II